LAAGHFFPGHRRMRNVTNYFLVNLSVADLATTCLNTIFSYMYMRSRFVLPFLL